MCMPDLVTEDAFLEWLSHPWPKVVRRDPSFVERHLHRPVTLRSHIAGYLAGTRATVVQVQVQLQPFFTVRTLNGDLLTVRVSDLLFESDA